MFRAIVSKDPQHLRVLGERFHQRHKNEAAALLCLDHAFTCRLDLEYASQADVMTTLKHFLLYSRLLLHFASQPQLSSLAAIQRLFGFTSEVDSEDFFVVHQDTLLYASCNSRALPSIQLHEQGIAVLRTELDFLLRQQLRDHLCIRVTEENQMCRNGKAFHPCIAHVAFSRCSRIEHCPLDHVPSEKFDVEFFNLRVRIVLQQILIYTTAHAIIPWNEQAQHRRYVCHFSRGWMYLIL